MLLPSAGFHYTWNRGHRRRRLRRLTVDPVTITLNGVPIDPAATYRVTVNSFLADGGDGFTVLREGTDRLGGAVDTDAFEAYLDGERRCSPRPPRTASTWCRSSPS